jgi:hypothetical protein
MNLKGILKGVTAVVKLPVKGVNAAANATVDSLLHKTLLSLARHGLTSLGALLVSRGYLTGNDVSDLIGSGMVLAGFAWSILEKKYLQDAAKSEAQPNG